jgi:hypothetical protein
MSRYRREPFDVAGPFVVRRTFTFNGETFYQDDNFPLDGVSNRRVRQLYDNRRIDMDVMPAVVVPVVDSTAKESLVVADDPVVSLEFTTEPDPVAVCDLPDDELFARAMEATGVRYRVRDRAIKALESL